LTRVVIAATLAAVNFEVMLESSLQKFFHHVGDVSQSSTHCWTMSAKP
jgi:hypothetical protein